MKNKECPACAMEIEITSRVCPICGYEFVGHRPWIKWLALLLILVFLLSYFVF